MQLVWAVAAGAALFALARVPTAAQQTSRRGLVSMAGLTIGEVREAASRVDGMRRGGELRLRTQREDPVLAGRTHERFDQYFRGVRVFGADVVQQVNRGQVVSVFGNVYDDIDIDTNPEIDEDRVRVIVQGLAGVEIGREPELVILPRDGEYILTWRLRAMTGRDVREYFIDADTGSLVFDYSDMQTQASAVGRATGVLGDTKKISTSPSGSHPASASRRSRPN